MISIPASPKPYVERSSISAGVLWKQSAPALSRLDIELTERCNNNCIHCYINLPANDAAAKRKELSTDAFKKILREAVSLGCMSVRFTGGEPLLRRDFEELYLYARMSGLKVTIFTNGTLITSRLAGLWSRVPPLERIEVSVYGMKKKSYESVTRTVGSYESAWRGIRLLKKSKVPFIVKNALLPGNIEEQKAFDAWARKIPWMDRSPGYAMFYYLRARRYDGRKNDRIRSLRLSPEKGLEVLTRNKARYIREMKDFCSKFMRPSGDTLFSCGAGCGGCVDACGKFQPCMMVRHPDTVYDLKKGSLKRALEVFFPKLRKMKAANPEYLKRCAVCFLHGLCEQCPGQSWMEHGTLDTPVEYQCRVAHAQARYLGLIGKNERAWEVKDWQKRIDDFARS
ncbi:MAG: radical SAM protein [Candidatus Omnitrophica bacterium]|nr:radical SAM protein [Candidatus Omnitrophota bacterium]MDD5775394.1 radical SAM protein [Candidatus Omnitrophota bacterium]